MIVERFDPEDVASIKEKLERDIALQCFSSFVGWSDWADKNVPEAQVWYTERNGDGIIMLLKKGIDPEVDFALDYMAFEWIHPNKDFGTGYRVKRWQK